MLAYYLHDLDPVIFKLWVITPRWYGFAYLMGFLCAYLLIKKLSRDGMLRVPPEKVSDMVLNSCIFGVLVGGRLGFCLFYDLPRALADHATPLLYSFTDRFPYWGLLRVNEGGMSAHGGIVFTILALVFFARRNKLSFTNLADAAAMVVPVGLCFGRIANFINGELYGHVTNVPWAVKFPSEIWSPTNGQTAITPGQFQQIQSAVAQFLATHPQEMSAQTVRDFLTNHPALAEQLGVVDLESATQLAGIQEKLAPYLGQNPALINDLDLARWWEHGNAALHQVMHTAFSTVLSPRHPSQLYEALLEGVVLWLIVWTIGRLWRKDGMAAGAFLVFYPIMRIVGEQFRVGDTPVPLLGINISKGILYSAIMLLPAAGYWLYWIRRDRRSAWVKPVAPVAAKSPEVGR